MKRKKFVSALLAFGTLCAMLVSCGNNNSSSNEPSSSRITNDDPTMEIGNVEWETTSESRKTTVSDQSKTSTSQNIQIGNPELVKYLNVSVKKDFSYACYALTEIVNDTKTFSFDFDNDGTSENVVIMYSQDRLKVLGNSKKTGFVIMDFGESELEDLRPEYIQVSAYDFDEDGRYEMILSAGDGIIQCIHEIFNFNPDEANSFNLVEVINSQQDLILNKNEIEASYGGIGLIDLYEYKGGRIIQIQ